MGEIAKYITAGIFFVSVVVAALMWSGPGIAGLADETNRQARIISTSMAITTFGVLLWAIYRRDKAPDYLRNQVQRCFERRGLCFAVVPHTRDNIFSLLVYHQNRNSKPCTATVLLVPAQGRAGGGVIAIPFCCEAAGFGVTRVPLAIPASSQGERFRFYVYADVKYPGGRGRMVRFREGGEVGGTFSERSENVWVGVAMLALGLDSGKIPATIEVQLPHGVATDLPPSEAIASQTFWRLGDADLDVRSITC